MTVDPLLTATVADLLADVSPAPTVRSGEGVWAAGLWDTLAEAGLTGVGVPEAAGGTGGSVEDAAAVVRLTARASAPVPLADHLLVAGWLLASCGASLPAGPAVVAPRGALVVEGSGARGQLRGVPWAGDAAAVVVLVEGAVVVLDPGSCSITTGHDLAGERRDTVDVDGPADVLPTTIVADDLRRRGALVRSLQIAGACDAVLALCLRHAGERQQFGRTLDRFQAVAQRIALLGEETARAGVAADLATALLADSACAAGDVAVCKVTAGEAATAVARHAHQITGAIGVSAEFDLQLSTRRLYAWRDDWGNEARWAKELGHELAAAGAGELWGWLSA